MIIKTTAGWTAIWWDEFEATSLDSKKWRYDRGDGIYDIGLWAWGNDEEQYYTKSNVALANGNLGITAKREDVLDYKYTSGRVSTYGKASFFPGMANPVTGSKVEELRIELRAKAPQPGKGLWAAIWMEAENPVYGKWSSSGEIDLFEMKNEFTRMICGVHYGGEYPQWNRKNTDIKTFGLGGGKAFADDFSTLTLQWKKDRMTCELHVFSSSWTFLYLVWVPGSVSFFLSSAVSFCWEWWRRRLNSRYLFFSGL
jgi:beta-glucanase (GH16 family)